MEPPWSLLRAVPTPEYNEIGRWNSMPNNVPSLIVITPYHSVCFVYNNQAWIDSWSTHQYHNINCKQIPLLHDTNSVRPLLKQSHILLNQIHIKEKRLKQCKMLIKCVLSPNLNTIDMFCAQKGTISLQIQKSSSKFQFSQQLFSQIPNLFMPWFWEIKTYEVYN